EAGRLVGLPPDLRPPPAARRLHAVGVGYGVGRHWKPTGGPGMRAVLLRGVFTSHAECQAPGRTAWGSPFDADESFLSRRGAVAQDVPHVRAARLGRASCRVARADYR